MPAKKKTSKKEIKEKGKKKDKKIEMEVEGGLDDLGGEMSFDFNDEEDSKPSKSVKQKQDQIVQDNNEEESSGTIDLGDIKYLKVKGSKPISQIKKGDKMKVDGLTLEVDSHYVLIDHEKTKEMAIELYDSKTDKDYQLRYFSDQMETSMEFYELDEIVYNKKDADKV